MKYGWFFSEPEGSNRTTLDTHKYTTGDMNTSRGGPPNIHTLQSRDYHGYLAALQISNNTINQFLKKKNVFGTQRVKNLSKTKRKLTISR